MTDRDLPKPAIDRDREKIMTYKGIRELEMPANCKLYGLSIIRQQEENRKVTYIPSYKNQYGKEKTFSWKPLTGLDTIRKIDSGKYPDKRIKTELLQGAENYISFLESEADLNQYLDFLENGNREGFSEVVLEVIWEQIDRDIEYWRIEETPEYRFVGDSFIDRYNDLWLKNELTKHPEYGENGGNALAVKLEELQIKHPELFEDDNRPQHMTLLSPEIKITEIIDTASYIAGKRDGYLIGQINTFSKQTQLATELYPYCKRCFRLEYTEGEDCRGYVKLDIPVKPELSHWHSPLFEVCPRCHRKGCFTIVPINKTFWDLTLVNPRYGGSVPVIGVSVFDLAKGDVIAVKGRDVYLEDKDKACWGRVCEGLQILTPEIIRQLNLDSPALAEYANAKSLPKKLQALTSFNVGHEIRKLFFGICEREANDVDIDYRKALVEIYKNNEDLRHSPIFKINANGELVFDTGKNNDLKEFLLSLTERQTGDKGILKKIGHKPITFKWYPTEAEG